MSDETSSDQPEQSADAVDDGARGENGASEDAGPETAGPETAGPETGGPQTSIGAGTESDGADGHITELFDSAEPEHDHHGSHVTALFDTTEPEHDHQNSHATSLFDTAEPEHDHQNSHATSLYDTTEPEHDHHTSHVTSLFDQPEPSHDHHGSHVTALFDTTEPEHDHQSSHATSLFDTPEPEHHHPAHAGHLPHAESAAAAPLPGHTLQLDPTDLDWWRSAVVYQVYPRSFSDSDGDGVGDLGGIIERLGYLELLGVDALWLSPIMTSPMADHGYDVSDPRDVDPLFGDLADFDELIADAHDREMRVIMDLVPNHTSDQHPWFVEALAAAPGSPARERYIFRDGRGEHGEEPPNNWHSVFGGPAWTRVVDADGRPGQWYLHIFAAEQPDLNWENPEVMADLAATMRFWLDRGVDGFRIDVAHGMAKPPELPDMAQEWVGLLTEFDDDPRFNNPAVHEIHRGIRSVIDEYPGAVNVGEIWLDDNERFAEYLRPDELHLGFNFRLAKAAFDVDEITHAIDNSLTAVRSVDGVPTWTLSNHDVVRTATRYTPETAADATAEERAVAARIGLDRARAMLLVQLALPGTVFLYNGEELGLPNVEVPAEAMTDPIWERSGGTKPGRDGCRIPLPWEGTEPPYAFSTTAETWLPMPQDWAEYTVEAQLEDLGSTLTLCRQAIDLRAMRPEFSGDEIQWYGAPAGALAFRRAPGMLVCALNTTDTPVPMPPGEVLLTSAPLVDGMLAPNAAVWLV